MVTKKIIAPLIAVILIAGISGVFAAKRTTERRITQTLEAPMGQTLDKDSSSATTPQSSATGRYAQYHDTAVQDVAYNQTILFFYAAWCPECRSFKQAIAKSEIPAGTQVLEINYDSASDLKKKHGITLQSTFVKVDQSGNQQSKWVGYGKDKSLQAVLDNLN